MRTKIYKMQFLNIIFWDHAFFIIHIDQNIK